jgi:hypothetical protein
VIAAPRRKSDVLRSFAVVGLSPLLLVLLLLLYSCFFCCCNLLLLLELLLLPLLAWLAVAIIDFAVSIHTGRKALAVVLQQCFSETATTATVRTQAFRRCRTAVAPIDGEIHPSTSSAPSS